MSPGLRGLAGLTVFAMGLLPVLGGASASAEDAPSTMIVLDGSGSMWGRLPPDNRAKIDIVREKLATTLQSFPETRVGLVSFGHRRRGDCSDVEVIAQPDANRDPLVDPIAKLNPRGRGPLVGAIKAAVAAIGAARPARLLVINDGMDNCLQDACAASAEIAKTAPGVVIHVIGIGVPEQEKKQISCIADATGGRFFDAPDSQALVSAIDEASKLAMMAPGAAISSGTAPSAAPAADAAPQPPAGASLRVSAVLSKGGPLLTVPLRWRIFKTGETTALEENEGRDLTLKLDPGNYDIEAQLGRVTAHENVQIEAGSAVGVIVPLDAAHLKVRAAAVKGGEPSTSAIVTISSGEKPVTITRGGSVELYLPPAAYSVIAADGTARITETMTLSAGDEKDLDLGLGTGRLEVSTSTGTGTGTGTATENGKLDDVLYTVFEDDPESPDGRREVARSRAAVATFILQAGTYYVSARSNAGEVRQRIAVGVNADVKQTLNLPLVPLKISASIAGAPATAQQGIVYRVNRLDGNKAEIARAVRPELALSLPPGQYRISAALPAYHLSSSADVTLEAGKPAAQTIDIAGAEIRFRPPAGQRGLASDTSWEIVDAKGDPVWRALGTETMSVLAPGRYSVRLDARGQRKEAAFEVKAGENKLIEIGPG